MDLFAKNSFKTNEERFAFLTASFMDWQIGKHLPRLIKVSKALSQSSVREICGKDCLVVHIEQYLRLMKHDRELITDYRQIWAMAVYPNFIDMLGNLFDITETEIIENHEVSSVIQACIDVLEKDHECADIKPDLIHKSYR